jgi:hypothetical protein
MIATKPAAARGVTVRAIPVNVGTTRPTAPLEAVYARVDLSPRIDGASMMA